MARLSPRAGPVAALAVAAVLASPVRAAEVWDALVHLRHPDGREESVRVLNLRFVFYDRRFIRHPSGIGKKAVLEVKDLPREERWIQNDDLRKIRFVKIRRIQLEYRPEQERRTLHVVVTRKKRDQVVWPALLLRNAVIARPPHFRGEVEGKTVDFWLPPVVESVSPDSPVIREIEIDFPGQRPHRDRF